MSYHLDENTNRETMNKILLEIDGVFDEVLDYMLENDLNDESEISDNTMRDIMIKWIKDGDETYKH